MTIREIEIQSGDVYGNQVKVDEAKGENRPKGVLNMPEKREYSGQDAVFAVLSFVIGYLYIAWIGFANLGAGVTAFAVLFCIYAGTYLHLNGYRQTRGSLLWLAVVLVSAVNFSLIDNGLIKLCNLLFLSIAAVYWICVSAGRQVSKGISIYTLGDIISQYFWVAFGSFGSSFSGVRRLFGKNRQGKTILAAFAGLLIFLPILAMVMSLLMSADANFEGLVNRLIRLISLDFTIYLIQFLLGIPVACYLFGLICGNVKGWHTDHLSAEAMDRAAGSLRVIPSAAVYTAMTLLNLIYLIFLITQATYLFSAIGNVNPTDLTYAEYARRGFFELCAIAGINLCVMTAAHLIMERRPKEGSQSVPMGLKVQTIILSTFTMLLILTAISKMVMYIGVQGMTQLRIYTTWFMGVLFILFAIALLRQFLKFNGTRVMAASFMICFALLCYGNVDGMIAKYNIGRYQEGTLKTLDIGALASLSAAADPYLYELYQTVDGKTEESQLMKDTLCPEYLYPPVSVTERVKNFNWQMYQTEQIRKELGAPAVGHSD